jgi:thymidylate synthase
MGENIDIQYLNLLKDILNNGNKKLTRNGEVLSVFGRQIRHNMSLGFPLLTTKEINFQNIKSELAWFLAGSSDIRFLWKHKCYIWDGDFYKRYCQITKDPISLKELRKIGVELWNKDPKSSYYLDGVSYSPQVFTLGPIYGHQWIKWGGSYSNQGGSIYGSSSSEGFNQIQQLLYDLEHNPDSRRMMVNAWNVGQLSNMTLPPCHYGFQVYTRKLSVEERKQYYKSLHHFNEQKILGLSKFDHKYFNEVGIPTRSISLIWTQRSVDTPLGLPYNIASYGLLLEMLANEFNMVPDELIGQLGDVHIYNNQIDGVYEQIERIPKQLPKIKIQDGIWSNLSKDSNDVILEDYNPYPNINYPLSN